MPDTLKPLIYGRMRYMPAHYSLTPSHQLPDTFPLSKAATASYNAFELPRPSHIVQELSVVKAIVVRESSSQRGRMVSAQLLRGG